MKENNDAFQFQWNNILSDDYKAEIQISKFITIKNILIMSVYAFGMMLFFSLVADSLKLPYIIFNLIVGFLLSLNSQENPGKRIYEQFYLDIFKRNNKKENLYEMINIKKERRPLNIRIKKYSKDDIEKIINNDYGE